MVVLSKRKLKGSEHRSDVPDITFETSGKIDNIAAIFSVSDRFIYTGVTKP